MTAAELITELQKHPPGKEVMVCLRTVTMLGEEGDWSERLTEEDALAADDVRNEGGFVLIWGGRP
jgi:hypothetical protein